MAKQTFTTGQVLTAAQMTSLQQTAMGGGSTTAKTASYVLVAADAGTVVQMNSASATTITVNTALFAAGDTVQIQNVGAGVCTVTAGTATVSTSSTLALKQYDAGSLYFNTTSAALFFAVDAADSTSPLTTKGDLYGFSTLDARIPIGSNNQVLTADSAQALGLKWATPATAASGLTFITGTTFSSAASVSFPVGTFSATYLAYKVIFEIQSGTGAAVLSARFRISGTDNSTANYYGALNGIQSNGTAVSARSGGATSQDLGVIEATNNAPFFTFDISNPFASVRTDFAGSSVFCVPSGAGAYGSLAGFFNSTTSFDSMSFNLATGLMSGYYKVYGYANS